MVDSQPTGAESLPPHRYTAALANEIESKWLARWDERGTYLAPNPAGDLSEPNHELAEREPYFALDMFPYPSGSGLHVGHPLGYIGTDVFARYKRMRGFNVLHAMGYDAFGLPAERYAVDTGQHPAAATANNIVNMRRQLRRLGLGHDPRRSVATTDPEYYRWTQWIFLQLYHSWFDPEANAARPIAALVAALDSGERAIPKEVDPGSLWSELNADERADVLDGLRLAFLADVMVNWCAELGTVLANEEVTADGRSEQGDFPVFRRPLRQWMMRITAYADRLLEDLAPLEWPESLKAMQVNWIGRSVGARVDFTIEGHDPLPAFTTRPDTLHGVTFIVVAPEHPLLDGELPARYDADVPSVWRGAGQGLADGGEDGFDSPTAAVGAYRVRVARMSDRAREIGSDGPTGVFTGLYGQHPVSGAPIPILVADYVLMHYGTGAVMGVPAHDTRDFAFARKFGLRIICVVQPSDAWLGERELAADTPADDWPEAYVGPGHGVNSGPENDGQPTAVVSANIVAELAELDAGEPRVSYKLRDWLFSRQRYWGEPFPIVHDEAGRAHALPDSDLPVLLPDLVDFAPGAATADTDPVPPLSRAHEWVDTIVDLGDGPVQVRRETNTMPQWAGSCWYYLRYLDPTNGVAFVDPETERYWMSRSGNTGGVDLYVGGVEHAVLHLLYARFWHKVLYDLGHVSTSEPFQRLFNQGYVQAYAFMNDRGFYVNATEVEERDGEWYHDGERVKRSYGKMGKSLKNSVTPDDIIAEHGADALRVYEMFLAPMDQDRPWDTQAIIGVSRFLQRIWRLMIDEDTGELTVSDALVPPKLDAVLHRTVAVVGRDIERMHFNTAIAAMMELLNATRAELGDGRIPRRLAEWITLMLAPFTPHLAEELWERLGHIETVVYQDFPEADPTLGQPEVGEIAVQVNGKLRALMTQPLGTPDNELERLALEQRRVVDFLAGRSPQRVIVVPDRIVNIVVT
jgi:leucyl-tRNA synthetase